LAKEGAEIFYDFVRRLVQRVVCTKLNDAGDSCRGPRLQINVVFKLEAGDG
jgi:hypothetical protein